MFVAAEIAAAMAAELGSVVAEFELDTGTPVIFAYGKIDVTIKTETC